MTRKKKTSAQQKRQQVTDSSGWTHVLKGARSITALFPTSPFHRLGTSLTVEAYSKEFQMLYSTHWLKSTCLPSLRSVFEQDVLTADRVILTKCVCLGLGCLTAGTLDSSFQLAALITMLEMLSVKFAIQEIIFQDPNFNAQDKAFLVSRGYTILEDPEAFSKIDDNTFLFAPHLDFSVLATALEKCTPAICVSNDMSQYIDGLYRYYLEAENPSPSEIFWRYLNQTVSKLMPEADQMNWANSMAIYWLKDTPDQHC